MEQVIGTYSGRKCPECGSGTIWRSGRYSVFHGCERFPMCHGRIGAPRGRAVAKTRTSDETSPPSEEVLPIAPPASERRVVAVIPQSSSQPLSSNQGLIAALAQALEPSIKTTVEAEVRRAFMRMLGTTEAALG